MSNNGDSFGLICVDGINDRLRNEPVIGALGMPDSTVYRSLKGDKSLKETVFTREKNETFMDRHAEDILSMCATLLKETGCFSVYFGFNNNEIRTQSIFNPFHYEVHRAQQMMEDGYADRHFIKLPYDIKMREIKRINRGIVNTHLVEHIPEHWRDILNQGKKTPFMDKGLIDDIIEGFRVLRTEDSFYLRTADISLGYGIVRTTYNCDGMYYTKAEDFPSFVVEMVDPGKYQPKKTTTTGLSKSGV